jgi:uncharacterized protein YbaP (TraB family)
MKKISFLIFCLLYTICTLTQSAQAIGNAIWAWEVKSKNRTVYLLGEVHKFISLEDLNIDYSLGESIYSISSTVWIEPAQQTLSSELPKTKISSQISPSTLTRLQRVNSEAIDATAKGITAEQKDNLLKKLINDIDKSSAFSVYAGIRSIAEIKNLKNVRGYKNLKGMSAHLFEIDSMKASKKIKDIEKSDSVERIWKDKCSDTADSEIIINAAIKYFEEGSSFETSQSRKIQNAFLKPETSEDDFIVLSEAATEAASIRKCNIVPRNETWLPLIIKALESDGAPESFLVGNNHVIGQSGLITLLKQQGYTNVKRVYKVK